MTSGLNSYSIRVNGVFCDVRELSDELLRGWYEEKLMADDNDYEKWVIGKELARRKRVQGDGN